MLHFDVVRHSKIFEDLLRNLREDGCGDSRAVIGRAAPGVFTAGRLAGSLKNKYARRARTLTLADTIVAAIAIERRCTLMTDNRKDFPMSELNCYNLPQS